ncbi:MAG TPA: hypothetical protein QF802_06000 [Candidatus Thalassarchaeaceae archaeon]|nr:hypothetical protein [Candidatus Thalassarchaeaceae archaeon]
MGQWRSRFSALFLVFILLLPGCFGGSEEELDSDPFPEFNSTADDNVTYSLSDFSGNPFIVLFSAEWCDTPCHMTMHAITSILNDSSMIVMSTDPQNNPQGITLKDWHDKADAHDDEDDDEGQTLRIPFMKGVDVSKELEIDARPTIIFVNGGGHISDIHEGALTNRTMIQSYWANAGGTI